MSAVDEARPKRGAPKRGTPRSERAILDAAYELLTQEGLEATTVEAIAARAGVSKVTIYKWWPNRAAVITSAFLSRSEDTLPYPERMTRDEIGAALLRMADSFRGTTGAVIRALIAEAQVDPGVAQAFRDGYLNARREHGRQIIRTAIAAGVIRQADPDVILDLLYAPLYFRLMVGHQPLTDEAVRAHVELALDGLLTE
ncbi:TetR/AcrR family transcriptional regulator [Nocardia jiangxiensis]|uniref:TetR/AcrR family transcriptional regulator n=1 Tax=Nocardia jiangxiensis TaxID=282685 RepID=UPI00031035B5|nr:TetR/AcrR family transcriptional regulator [Nocardia jiangxiensis]